MEKDRYHAKKEKALAAGDGSAHAPAGGSGDAPHTREQAGAAGAARADDGDGGGMVFASNKKCKHVQATIQGHQWTAMWVKLSQDHMVE
jgi:hypothetical protein